LSTTEDHAVSRNVDARVWTCDRLIQTEAQVYRGSLQTGYNKNVQSISTASNIHRFPTMKCNKSVKIVIYLSVLW